MTASEFGNHMDFGEDIATARTNFTACAVEARHAQQMLDNAYQALVNAAEQYGAALAREADTKAQPTHQPEGP